MFTLILGVVVGFSSGVKEVFGVCRYKSSGTFDLSERFDRETAPKMPYHGTSKQARKSLVRVWDGEMFFSGFWLVQRPQFCAKLCFLQSSSLVHTELT